MSTREVQPKYRYLELTWNVLRLFIHTPYPFTGSITNVNNKSISNGESFHRSRLVTDFFVLMLINEMEV